MSASPSQYQYGNPEAFPDTVTRRGSNGDGQRPPSIVRRQFDATKKAAIENHMGKSESWAKSIGDLRSGVLLDEIAEFLDAIGLKAVPVDYEMIDHDELMSLYVLSQIGCSLRLKAAKGK